MNVRTKQAVKALEAALLLGILGDGLLRVGPWGLNVLLWTAAVIASVVVLSVRWRRRTLVEGGHWLLLTTLLFASTFAWRDSATLNSLAGICICFALALTAWRARAGRIWLASATEYVIGSLLSGINAFVVGFPLLFGEVHWNELSRPGWKRHAKAILHGLVMGIPLLVLFSALFASADAGFARVINRIFLSNHESVIGHILLAFILAWISGGFLRSILFGREVTVTDGRIRFVTSNQMGVAAAESIFGGSEPPSLKRKPMSLGIVEIGVALGLLNLLFLSFVLLQLRYFFGGASLVQQSDLFTYAEYYRQGFFELVTVTLLVLPILLGAHWLLDKSNSAHERIFRILAGVQVILVFVVMVSAVRRMLLYQSEYGLTELRLYTTAFMAWLALVFVWFIATVLRGRRDRFACGAMVAGFLIVATLHLINPDALIVRVNVAHAQAGRSFDATYATTLSADATPALLESLPVLNPHDQGIVATEILGYRSEQEGGDWRTWNWSRSESRRAVDDKLQELRAISLRRLDTMPAIEGPPKPAEVTATVATAKRIPTVQRRRHIKPGSNAVRRRFKLRKRTRRS